MKLFRRSHCFREKVLCDLEKVVELTTGNNLPPPESVARELKRFTLRAIHQWNDKFGDKCIKLRNCYRYLREVKKVSDTANVTVAAIFLKSFGPLSSRLLRTEAEFLVLKKPIERAAGGVPTRLQT